MIEVYKRTPERDRILNTIPKRSHVAEDSRESSVVQKKSKNAVSYEYTGYFKLVLLEENETGEDGESVRKYFVSIVDGATYDPAQTPVSGKSVCKVNNVTFSLDPYQSGEITETSIFALRYTAPVEADEDTGTEAEAEKVEIVNLTEEGYSSLPSDTSGICYYQIGRAIVTAENDGSIRVTIQQDHQATASNGIPQIFRYALCED